MRRPAIIFDFGNVIAHFDFDKSTSKLGAKLGITGRELLERLEALRFKDLLQDYESGRSTAVEFGRRLLQLVNLEIAHDEFAAAWADIFTANDSIIPVVEGLKGRGHRLVLGSNTNDLHAAHFRTQFAATLAHFDRLVLSYEVGHLKPNREFYLACAEAAGLPPGDCVFIDDMPVNVAGARAAGLHAILYESTPQLIADLRQLGVEVPAA